MSRFLAGRNALKLGIKRHVKCHVRTEEAPRSMEPATDEYEYPAKGFCHECESFVDEAAGKLHRPTCKTTPERRRSA